MTTTRLPHYGITSDVACCSICGCAPPSTAPRKRHDPSTTLPVAIDSSPNSADATTKSSSWTLPLPPMRRRRPVAPSSGTLLGPSSEGLDASFVNVLRSPSPVEGEGGRRGRRIDGIDSVLEEALRFAACREGEEDGVGNGRRKGTYGHRMKEAARRMDAFLESTMEILTGCQDAEDDDGMRRNRFCRSCLER